jgi:hypothetical protein
MGFVNCWWWLIYIYIYIFFFVGVGGVGIELCVLLATSMVFVSCSRIGKCLSIFLVFMGPPSVIELSLILWCCLRRLATWYYLPSKRRFLFSLQFFWRYCSASLKSFLLAEIYRSYINTIELACPMIQWWWFIFGPRFVL